MTSDDVFIAPHCTLWSMV